ncbi:MAG: toprim domain-containing protein, partial [Bacteroidota bacterium]
PKYLNSPETPVFHKGRELYGRWQAARRGRLDQMIVVEGYMDVVALAQHGVTNAVASLGTAATSDHLENLFRLTPEVVFCFDGDTAGRRAAWRALENALPQMREGRSARFMFLPEGEDPDSLVRGLGPDVFRERVGDAVNLSEYLFQHLSEDLDLSSIEGQSRLHETGRPLLELLPDGPFKTLVWERMTQLTGLKAPGATFQTKHSEFSPPI